MKQQQVSKAIDSAKAKRASRAHDQTISRDLVHIMELVQAHEDLCSINHSAQASRRVGGSVCIILDALINQEIIAVTHEDDAVIPANVWEIDRAWGEEPYHHLFWLGWLQYLDERDRHEPFEGKIPVVARAEAEAWLLKNMNAGRHTGAPKIHGIKSAYYNVYPDGHKAEQNVTWREACAKVGERVGRPVSIDTLKRRLGLRE